MADDDLEIPLPPPAGWFTKLLMWRQEEFRKRALMGYNFHWRIIIGLIICATGDIVLAATPLKTGPFWGTVRLVISLTFACFVVVGILTAFKRAVEYRAGYHEGRTSMLRAMKEAHDRGMNPYEAMEREAMRDLARQGIPMEALEDMVSRLHGENGDSYN